MKDNVLSRENPMHESYGYNASLVHCGIVRFRGEGTMTSWQATIYQGTVAFNTGRRRRRVRKTRMLVYISIKAFYKCMRQP